MRAEAFPGRPVHAMRQDETNWPNRTGEVDAINDLLGS